MDRRDAAGFPLRGQSAPGDHALASPSRREGQHARFPPLLEAAPQIEKARPNPVSIAAELQNRFALARGISLGTARRFALRFRVPPRILVRRGSVSRAAEIKHRFVTSREREAANARRSHRGFFISATAKNQVFAKRSPRAYSKSRSASTVRRRLRLLQARR